MYEEVCLMRDVDVVVVDYEAGNLRSVETALSALGVRYVVSGDPEVVRRAGRVVVPGVGEARACMGVLRERGLDEALREVVERGGPFLGICIGCQLVLEFSEERETDTLGFLRGRVVRFPSLPGLKVPHMGWNGVEQVKPHPLFEGIPSGASFYFVHSYYPVPEEKESIVATTEYGVRFASAFAKDNLFAVQFHPEKSGPYGLRLLENFFSL